MKKMMILVVCGILLSVQLGYCADDDIKNPCKTVVVKQNCNTIV